MSYSLRSRYPYPCRNCQTYQSIQHAVFCDSCATIPRNKCFKCQLEINATNRTYLIECKDEDTMYPPNEVEALMHEGEIKHESVLYCPKVPRSYYAYQDNPYIERRIQREDLSKWWYTYANTKTEWGRIVPFCLDCAFSMSYGLCIWNNVQSYNEARPIADKSQFVCC